MLQAALFDVPDRVGRYPIVCELARGGMGTIYLARAAGAGGFEQLIAVKMVHPHLSKERAFIDMFLDEAKIAALIRHPNVIPVHEVGLNDGRHFIAMDYVSGESLSTLLDHTWCRGIPLDIDIAALIVAEACDALHAAHDLLDPMGRALDVVHRDVCPQNIMVGYDGISRVMDFGVAKALHRLTTTNPGTHKGKIPYMAPEQIRCDSIDRRSDVFSLGIVLWESTVGKRLFKGECDTASASKVLKGNVPRPSQLRETYPSQLEAIALKALRRRPEERFQSAQEMGCALRDYLAHRGSAVSSAQVQSLLKEVCRKRFEKRIEMERRASQMTSSSIADDAPRLLPDGTVDMRPPNAASPASACFLDIDDGADDETVRVDLEEVRAEYAVLFGDALDEPPLPIEGARAVDFPIVFEEPSVGRRFEEESRTAPSADAPAFISAQLGSAETTKRRRKRMIAAASLIGAALLALGLGIADRSPATEPPAAEQASLIENPPASPPKVTIEAELTDSPMQARPPLDPQEPSPAWEARPAIPAPVTIDEPPAKEELRPAAKKPAPRKPRPPEEKQPAPLERLLVQPDDL